MFTGGGSPPHAELGRRLQVTRIYPFLGKLCGARNVSLLIVEGKEGELVTPWENTPKITGGVKPEKPGWVKRVGVIHPPGSSYFGR